MRYIVIALSLTLVSGWHKAIARQEPKPAPPISAESNQEKLILEDGTPVKLKLLRALSSTTEKTDAKVEFEIIEEVKVGDVIVIACGATATGTVIEARPARRMGRTGKLDVRIDSAQLANGQKVALRAVRKAPNGSRTAEVAMGVAAAGLLFFPAAPLFLLFKGENINVPKDTLVTSFVNGNHQLQRTDFSSSAK